MNQKKKLTLKIKTLENKAAPWGNTNDCSMLELDCTDQYGGDPGSCGVGKVAAVAYF
jgi:hypothetical protein